MADNQNNNVEFTSNKDQHLKRSLKARHMNMIAMARCKDEPFLLAAFLSGVQHTMEFQNFAAFA